MDSPNHFRYRATRIILVILFIYGVLVATHEGEFWPFSIYPMFSQAGNPWTRAMVTDVTDEQPDGIWEITKLEDARGVQVPVGKYGVDQIDFSNFVSKTDHWTPARKKALITMFGAENIEGRIWMVMKVTGRMTDSEEVEVVAIPFLKLRADTVLTNPFLPQEEYLRGGRHE